MTTCWVLRNELSVGQHFVVEESDAVHVLRRKYVQFHNHRLEFLQIVADVRSVSAGIFGHHIRIVVLLHRLRFDGHC